jgi:glycosyltransferase involved in cell wall biosynthesis
MNRITYCIPSKNNLRYLKNSIESIKKNSILDYEILVYIDSDNDGTENWLKENNISYLKNNESKPKGIAYAYNRCIEAATTDLVCMFHADMFMAKGFDQNLVKHIKPKTVVAGTRIEPPLHPEGKEKIVMNFGMYPEDFTEIEFNLFVEEQKEVNKDKTTKGLFAPWLCYKSDLMEIQLHDDIIFHSYHEDSDIFNRMILSGMQGIQSRDALVYHLTCRGGRFQDGIEKQTSDQEFHKMSQRCAKDYIRKWGSWIDNTEYQYPIIHSKYDIGFIVNNCNLDTLTILEPWCDNIYINDDMNVIGSHYIDLEQDYTKFNLKNKIKLIGYDIPNNDIIVEFDSKKVNVNNFELLSKLSQIIKQSGEVGQFELDIFKITINQLNEYQDKLITLSDNYYTSKLL